MEFTLAELAVRFGLELSGDPAARVSSVATLKAAAPGQLAFLANIRYRKQLAGTGATVVVMAADAVADCPTSCLISGNPYASYARIAAVLHPPMKRTPGVDPTACIAATAQVATSASIGPMAVIGDGAVVGERVQVGAHCVIGERVRVGNDCDLGTRTVLCRDVVLGERCVLQPGAVIGSEGFGFARDTDGYVKVPQLGSVRIGNDVEIGANTTIDCGAIDDTVIEDGVKLDNQVQVGHNCRIGAHTVIAGCVGISGSTTIGKRCMIGGAVGMVGHLEIGDDVIISGFTMVTHSLPGPGMYSSGMPAVEAGDWRKQVARLRRLEGMERRLRRLERGPDSGEKA